MRFSVSATLDAIETRLTLDPALAGAVLDVAGVVRVVELDGDTSRPASLLRLGHAVDALATHLAEDGVLVHPVAPRAVLSDLDLTANERMVLRRWADDGRVEVLDDPGDRVLDLAALLGVPVVSAERYAGAADRHPWLPDGLLAPRAGGLLARGGPVPAPAGGGAMSRLWRCEHRDCAAFGSPHPAQRPPGLVAAAPTCPYHGTRLADAGPRPDVRVLAVRVDGAWRARFPVREGYPVVVGRSPETGVALGPWLGEEALRWVSRAHLRLELAGGTLTVVDTSTNGTVVRSTAGRVRVASGQAYGLGADDVVELHRGVELARPARGDGEMPAGAPVMAEAPTVSLRRAGSTPA